MKTAKTKRGSISQTRKKFFFNIPLYDLSLMEEPETALHGQLENLFDQPFDLSQAPLLNAVLFRLDDETHVLFCSMHHIISDGWSIGVFIRELSIIYNALRSGSEPRLIPLPLQYVDYARWQHQRLEAGDYDSQRDYWLKLFEDDIPVLEFPTEKPRPSVKTYNGDSVEGFLDNETLESLNHLFRSARVTPFMGLLAAVKTLLFRYTRQQDIIVGTPVAGRSHPDLREQIGFYVNTLALRTRFNGTDSFSRLLENVRQTTRSAYQNQDYPFDRLIHLLNPEKDMSRSPLFDVMVSIQQTTDHIAAMNLQGIQASDIDSRPYTQHISGRFDLTFNFNPGQNGISFFHRLQFRYPWQTER